MEIITKITSTAGIVLLIASIVMGAGLIGQKNVYVCLDNNQAMQCDSLSKINVEGTQTRCYFISDKNVSTYKICNSGWIKFENPKVINTSVDINDYVCNNGTLIKECINKDGGILIRVKNR